MATILKAGNVASGAQITSDATGILEIKTGTGAGTTAITVGTNQAVTFAAGTTVSSLTTSGAVSAGSLTVNSNNISAVNSLGFRNRIINGDMRIDQRNNGASGTGTDNYVVDRMRVQASQTGKWTWGQNLNSVTPPTGYRNYVGISSSSAYSLLAGDYFLLTQAIEGTNFGDLAFGTAGASSVTLSFWVRSSLTGTFSGSLMNSAQSRSYVFTYTISSANTWEQKSITVPGDTSGTWLTDTNVGVYVRFSLGVGSTYSTSAGSWVATAAWSATGSTNVMGTNGATFYITGVQLEAGSVATPFERRDYGRELMMCQRYLFAYRSSSTSEYITFGQAAGTTIAVHNFAFPVTTRVPPTGVTVSSAGHFYPLNGSVSSAPGAASSVTFESGTTIGAQVRTTVASGLTTGQGSYLYTVSTSAVLYFTGCEL